MTQEKLFALQSLDLALDDLSRQIDEQGRREPNFRESADNRRRERDQIHQKHKTTQVDARRLELAIDEAKTKRASLEQKVLRVVNARELEAITKEIESLRQRIDELETELLGQYEAVDKLEADLKRCDGDLARRAQELVKLAAEVEQKLREFQQEKARLQASRAEAEAQVDAAIVSRYAVSRKKHGGQVVLEVVENSCGGCGLSLPGFEWNRIRQNPGNVYDCSNCGRLLVFVGEPP